MREETEIAIMTSLEAIILQLKSIDESLKEMRPKKKTAAPVKRFESPSVGDVMFYMAGLSVILPGDEAEKFVDFYSSKNWMVGKTKMKDWKAAVRNWIRRTQDEKRTGPNGSASAFESKAERAKRLSRENRANPDSI